MKMLFTLSGRIVMIVLAAFLVVGVTMSLVNTDTTTQFSPDRSTAFVQTQTTTSAGEDTTAVVTAEQSLAQSNATGEAMPSREFHGPTDQSWLSRLGFGLFGLVQSVGIIGAIVLVVVWIERRFMTKPVGVTG